MFDDARQPAAVWAAETLVRGLKKHIGASLENVVLRSVWRGLTVPSVAFLKLVGGALSPGFHRPISSTRTGAFAWSTR